MRRVVLTAAALLLAAPVGAEAHALDYGDAVRAFQDRANSVADQRARLTEVYSDDQRPRHLHAWLAEATWSPPDGTNCWVGMRVRFRSYGSRSIVVRLVDRGCYRVDAGAP